MLKNEFLLYTFTLKSTKGNMCSRQLRRMGCASSDNFFIDHPYLAKVYFGVIYGTLAVTGVVVPIYAIINKGWSGISAALIIGSPAIMMGAAQVYCYFAMPHLR